MLFFAQRPYLLVTLHVCSEEVTSCDCSWVGVAGGFAFFPSSRGEMQASGGPDTPLWARAHLAHRWTWRSCLSCCGSNAGTCVSAHMPSCSPGAYWGVGRPAHTRHYQMLSSVLLPLCVFIGNVLAFLLHCISFKIFPYSLKRVFLFFLSDLYIILNIFKHPFFFWSICFVGYILSWWSCLFTLGHLTDWRIFWYFLLWLVLSESCLIKSSTF